MFMVMIVSGEDVIAWDHVGVQVQEKIVNDAFVPPHPPNQTLNGWVKWWFKSMDPTLVPSINDAFVPPTPPTKN